MHGRTNAGGGINPFAFIFATYPAGSVCTCTDGSRTLRLKDTSGYGVFYPPYAGTWIVTATDPTAPTNTASESVEITTEGQSVSVELAYKLYIVKAGVVNAEVFGGLSALAYVPSTSSSAEKKPTVTTTEGSIKLNLSGDGSGTGGSYFTDNSIDLSDFKTMCIVVESAKTSSSGGYVRFGTTATRKNGYTVSAAKSISSESVGNISEETLLSLNIEDETSERYLFINLYGAYDKSITFSDWWLE